ncbi:MAG: hypothetical protein FD129_2522, partial [bacterium]
TYTRYEITQSLDGFASPYSTPVAISDNLMLAAKGIGGLSVGTTYFFNVRAFNGRASDFTGTAFSVPSTLGVVMLPTTPALAGTALSTGSVRWTWNQVTGAAGYRLRDAGASILADSGNPSFSLGGLSTSSMQTATIEAYNASGAGARGSAFTFTLSTNAINPVLLEASTRYLTLAWGSNGNSTSTYYEVVTATETSFAYPISTRTVTVTTATITDLFPGNTYYMKVLAINGNQLPAPKATTALKGVTYIAPGMSFSTSPASPYVPQAGIVGLWHFDATTGTVATDAATNQNHGTLTCVAAACTSTPTIAAGPTGLGNAAALTGVPNALVKIPDHAGYNFNGSITVGAWAKPVTANLPNG